VDAEWTGRERKARGAVPLRRRTPMSDVRKVTIDLVSRGTESVHHVTAHVNVGGSLVDVSLDSEQDPDLRAIVEQLYARLQTLAIQVVQTSLDRS
jgi:hypothetical protein